MLKISFLHDEGLGAGDLTLFVTVAVEEFKADGGFGAIFGDGCGRIGTVRVGSCIILRDDRCTYEGDTAESVFIPDDLKLLAKDLSSSDSLNCTTPYLIHTHENT